MATWLISGASRGFGREVALEALRRGDTVVATARNTDALTDIIDAGGDRVIPMTLDVADAEQVRSVTAEAEERTGGIDVLFNNAGIGYFAAFEEGEEAEERRLMEINVFGLAAVTKALLPGMRNRRSGTIINVSSVGGIRSFPALSWYNASKFAVEGLSEAIAHEVAPLGIHIVLVEPGPFATDWAGNSAAETKPEREIADYADTAGGESSELPPGGRSGTRRPGEGRDRHRRRRARHQPAAAPSARPIRLRRHPREVRHGPR